MDEGQLLLLWPGEVRRKREGDFGQIGPALLAGTNNCPSFMNKISSTSYCLLTIPGDVHVQGKRSTIYTFPCRRWRRRRGASGGTFDSKQQQGGNIGQQF